MIARHYTMIAQPGREDALSIALAGLAGKIRGLEGCIDVRVFRDADAPMDFVFVEYWTSFSAHKLAGSRLGKDGFSEVMATIAKPPEARSLEPVEI